MKVLQVANAFKPSWGYGGPARVCYEISRKLKERGLDVSVYTMDGYMTRLKTKKNSAVNVDGVETYYFRNLSMYFTKMTNFFLPYYMPLVARKKIRNFDIIHIHEHQSLLAVITCLYAKKYHVPYVLQAHGTLTPHSQKMMLKKVFGFFFGYDILRNATKVIALTEMEAKEYLSMGVKKENIEIIPNGMNFSECANVVTGQFRKSHSIGDDTRIILFLGRMHEIKGIDLLVDAFSELQKELDDIVLVLAGPDNGFLSTIKTKIDELMINDRVIMTGPVDNPIKTEMIMDSDIFILPSRYEAFAVVVLEACACGIPVIVTRKTNIGGLIEGKAGIVIDYDREQLISSMRELLKEKSKRELYGTNGKKLVKENFDLDRIVTRLEEMYSAILVQ